MSGKHKLFIFRVCESTSGLGSFEQKLTLEGVPALSAQPPVAHRLDGERPLEN